MSGYDSRSQERRNYIYSVSWFEYISVSKLEDIFHDYRYKRTAKVTWDM